MPPDFGDWKNTQRRFCHWRDRGVWEKLLAELADKGYDTNAIIEQMITQGMKPEIPPKKNRKEQREYDKYLYKMRHLVENAFLHL